MSVNRQDSNIIMKSIDQSLNSCESMVQSRVQSRVRSPGFVTTHNLVIAGLKLFFPLIRPCTEIEYDISVISTNNLNLTG